MAKQQLSIGERVGIAAELSMRAGAYHGLWYALASDESRVRNYDGLRPHWDALHLFQAGQLYALVMVLSGLFEDRPDTVNFRALSKALDGTAAADIERCAALVTKVVRLRHNLFAHRSAYLGVADVYRIASITSNDMKELADRALQIAAILCAKMGLAEPATPSGAIAAADELLAALQRESAAH